MSAIEGTVDVEEGSDCEVADRAPNDRFLRGATCRIGPVPAEERSQKIPPEPPPLAPVARSGGGSGGMTIPLVNRSEQGH